MYLNILEKPHQSWFFRLTQIIHETTTGKRDYDETIFLFNVERWNNAPINKHNANYKI